MPRKFIKCPFCLEGDFDLFGLKFHIDDCEVFDYISEKDRYDDSSILKIQERKVRDRKLAAKQS